MNLVWKIIIIFLAGQQAGQAGQQQFIIQQPQGGHPQIIQTADGQQAIVYSPISIDGSNFVQTPTGLIQLPTNVNATVNNTAQNVQQATVATTQQNATTAQQSPGAAITLPNAGIAAGNIVMVVPGAGGIQTVQRIPLPGLSLWKFYFNWLLQNLHFVINRCSGIFGRRASLCQCQTVSSYP